MTIVLLAALASVPQHQHVPGMHPRSSYEGLEARELKVYSDEEIRALENGEGMGYALVAELTHYPGPKHVLELAAALELTPDQEATVRQLEVEMHRTTVSLGRKVLEKERELQALFIRGEAEGASRLVAEIGALEGELRWSHLEAHVGTRRLLTENQIRRYDELRGYK